MLSTMQATAKTADGAIGAMETGSATDPKLTKLRDLFAKSALFGGAQVDAFIVPSEDPHMSEYPPECDARRAYISGFDGSAGTAVVTSTAAALWTDGRYFLQAEAQLGREWTLMRAGTPGVPEIHDWLISVTEPGANVGIDPRLHTIDSAERLKRELEAAGRVLVPLQISSTVSQNPVDIVWGDDRPAPPAAPLRIHPLAWAGASVSDKLEQVRREMGAAGAGALAVTMLDEVAWLLNLRGSDVPYNPVFVSYVIVTKQGAALYVDANKIGPEVATHLKEAGVEVKPYESAFDDVSDLAAKGTILWMDPTKVSYAMQMAASSKNPTKTNQPTRKRVKTGEKEAEGTPSGGPVCRKPSPISVAKAIKNSVELEGMREAHVRDGVALVKFFHWLDAQFSSQDSSQTITECDVDAKLTGFRAQQPGFIEPSFPTIAGSGPNGAIIHYRPMPGSCRAVDTRSVLLVDSGGQYDCGTTDVTRTIHLGTPTDHQRAAFTAVLKGHIALDTAVWPEGTPGCALDTLARMHLWKMGLNYRHGTGHGVGAALNVHEGPQSISARFGNTQPLLPDMICSNEPGYYEDGAFGIRIENLFVIVEAPTPFRFGGQSYYTCSRLTVCPLQKKMIDISVLSPDEVEWVNDYHKQVYDTLAPRLQGEELAWLAEATSPLK